MPARYVRWRAELNGRDVTTAFTLENADGSRETLPGAATYLGLLTGLVEGTNLLRVSAERVTPDQTLYLTNYPITGPIISGPHQTAVRLPDRHVQAARRIDARAARRTRTAARRRSVQYVYLPAGAQRVQAAAGHGATAGRRRDHDDRLTGERSVPFVVRVETGTMNRGIYQNSCCTIHEGSGADAVHAAAGVEPPADRAARRRLPERLVPPGRRDGRQPAQRPLTRLGEGYAIFTNTLNHPTNSCNAFLAGETTMMGKEHFIESSACRISRSAWVRSGGAYTSLQIADAFPGLFDGILINATFPDALSIASRASTRICSPTILRRPARRHAHRGAEGRGHRLPGHEGVRRRRQSERSAPIRCRPRRHRGLQAGGVERGDAGRRCDTMPATNPQRRAPDGLRRRAINIYGVDPKTGFALRPFDNVGVQYGLEGAEGRRHRAGSSSSISTSGSAASIRTPTTCASRSIGDAGAIKRAYQGGVTLGGGGGSRRSRCSMMARTTTSGGYHYQWFHFAIRERMQEAERQRRQPVMWRGPVQAGRRRGQLRSIDVGTEDRHANKPAEAVDRLLDRADADGKAQSSSPSGRRSAASPTRRCNTAYPSSAFTRYVAGGPIDANILKCQLKPIDAKDYPSFSPAELQRLTAIFPAACATTRGPA